MKLEGIKLNTGLRFDEKATLLNLIREIFPVSIRNQVQLELIIYEKDINTGYGHTDNEYKRPIRLIDFLSRPKDVPYLIDSSLDKIEGDGIQISLSSRVKVEDEEYHWIMIDCVGPHRHLASSWETNLLIGDPCKIFFWSGFNLPYFIQTENSYHCYYPYLVGLDDWKHNIGDQLYVAMFDDVNQKIFDREWLIASNWRGYGSLRIHKNKWLHAKQKRINYLPLQEWEWQD